MKNNFWKHTPLQHMSREQWESLCDRCGRCCLHKVEDEETGEIAYTDVVCHLFDHQACGCTDYTRRQERVPMCLHIDLKQPKIFRWLPDTCAYRLLYEGQPLYDWHPLVSGNPTTVIEAGISIQGACMTETYIHPDEISLRRAHWIECSKLDVK